MKESYYAIRIGNPKRHHPYLMLGPDKRTPALFASDWEAYAAIPKDAEYHRIVSVKITFPPTRRKLK